MKKLITNNTAICVGCNRCIRVCPIQEANIAMEAENSVIVKIDNEKCIACGACINACPHGSRGYEDDTERFFNDLKNGETISVLVAPALKTNFEAWEQLITWLKSKGVKKVFDVSLGADLCTWAHIRYLQKHSGKILISQPCPAIVNYLLKYQTRLIPHLSPVHSPMICTAIYMRKHEKIPGKIAALSPCIAKSHEFESTRLVDYNVTFHKLHNYIKNNLLSLPQERGRFDHMPGGLGFLYPMPGGLKENVEYYLGKSLRIDQSEGQQIVYKALDEYAKQPAKNLPDLFDVLNCAEGCNHGTGCSHEKQSIFQVHTRLNQVRQKATQGEGRASLEKLYTLFDQTLNMEDFFRKYTPSPVRQISISKDKIEKAFEKLGKMDEVTRKFNCGACGSDSCCEMAEKVAKGINTPSNCIDKAHRDLVNEHAELLRIQSANAKNLHIILSDMRTVKSGMDEIVSNMENVTDSIQDYNKTFSDIEKISMQINMIAINASIESARSGVHGKAFGVVAEEIRSLANKSKTSVSHSETSSANATLAIDLINKMIIQISQNIDRAYDHVTMIAENTQKIIKKT